MLGYEPRRVAPDDFYKMWDKALKLVNDIKSSGGRRSDSNINGTAKGQ